MSAFKGSQELKSAVLLRVEQSMASGSIERGPTAWRKGSGSLAGSLVGHADLTRGEVSLGLPTGVLELLDHFSGHIYFASIPVAEVVRDFFDACQPGTDLSSVPELVVQRLRDSSPDFQSDYLNEQPSTIDFIESWLDHYARSAVRKSGWSDADEAAAQSTLNDLWDQSRAQVGDDGWPELPNLLRQHDPELSAGFEAALELFNQTFFEGARQVFAAFIDKIAHAPVALDAVEPRT